MIMRPSPGFPANTIASGARYPLFNHLECLRVSHSCPFNLAISTTGHTFETVGAVGVVTRHLTAPSPSYSSFSIKLIKIDRGLEYPDTIGTSAPPTMRMVSALA